jgi:hypothetical protein
MELKDELRDSRSGLGKAAEPSGLTELVLSMPLDESHSSLIGL